MVVEFVRPQMSNAQSSAAEVGKSALYFLSDLSTGVTGEVHYVDGGFNIVVSA